LDDVKKKKMKDAEKASASLASLLGRDPDTPGNLQEIAAMLDERIESYQFLAQDFLDLHVAGSKERGHKVLLLPFGVASKTPNPEVICAPERALDVFVTDSDGVTLGDTLTGIQRLMVLHSALPHIINASVRKLSERLLTASFIVFPDRAYPTQDPFIVSG
jgi:hypothetical protein